MPGAAITTPAQALRKRTNFVAIPTGPFGSLLASTPTRTYVDPHHHSMITLDSRKANSEPFFLPESEVKPPPKKRTNLAKNLRTKRPLGEMPTTTHTHTQVL